MIRNEDLKHYIGTLTQAIAGPIMNDLQSAPVKELTGIVLTILQRIQTDLDAGDAIAASVLSRWQPLQQQAAQLLGLNASTASESGWQRLDQQIAALQARLADDAAFNNLVARLRDPHDVSRAWMRDTSRLLAELTRTFEDAFWVKPAPEGAAPAANPASGLREKLSRYLSQRFAELPADPIEEFRVASGGQSKLSVLFTLKPNPVLPQHLALRLDIPNTATPFRLDTEYPILQQVFALGLPVPEPHLFEPDHAHLGGAFVISAQVRDAAMGGSPFVEDRVKLGCNMVPEAACDVARLLATLHRRTYDPARGDSDVIREREATVDELGRAWRAMAKTPFSLQRDLAVAWMHANPLPAGRPVCLVHGEPGPHNILTREGRVVALLDWELGRYADPAEDLALCKKMLVGGLIGWDEFVRVYLDHGGLPEAADARAVAFYAVLLYVRHGVYMTGLRNLFVGGSADMKGAMISGHFVDRLNLYLAESLQEALALAD